MMACALLSPVLAAPYWTPEQIAEEFARRSGAVEPPFTPPQSAGGHVTLDERAYFDHYGMLCNFLVSMQYGGTGDNRGGMREGESGNDYGIIQTDNTQEAIRVWSQYAIWTGDTARYGANIRLARGYCERFPAWREEGGGYYTTHNCGWGFEAERKYREAYGDTSWTWYADSCAEWVVSHPLSFDPGSIALGQIEPCAEGLGLGGLYPHAVYRQRANWRNFALQEARLLRRWFESNPLRLNANEVWALCGGTALWGICESLFELYPDSGQLWLEQYGPQLDIWQSSGNWNHSFCAWYCNAQHVAFQITGDSTYWNNAVFITDSLIGLDTENDGGIPPGHDYPVTNDHSWVSSYMGWMGMERIINTAPTRDVWAAGFVSPSLSPHLAGDTLWVMTRVVNRGVIDMYARVTVTGFCFSDSMDVMLPAGRDSVLAFPQPWLPRDDESLPPRSPLTLCTASAVDENPGDDTLTVAFDVRRGCNVFGLVYGDDPPNTVPCRVEFYHEAYPDSLWTVTQSLAGQFYSNHDRRLMAGLNTIHVVPSLHYMIQEQTLELSPVPVPRRVDFSLSSTQLALVDDDAGDSLEHFFMLSLDSIPIAWRWWDKDAWGDAVLDVIPTVIWFTGNDSLTTLDEQEQARLEDYVNFGGHLLLTGQNITDNLGPDSYFLTHVLHCSSRTPDTDQRIVSGVSGDPISDGITLYLIGNGGAWNQTSPASVWPLAGSMEILHYSSGGAEVCGISGSSGDGRYVFLSFGLEAVSGVDQSTTRRQFLERFFAWFGDSLESARPEPAAPLSFELAQNFPNPFNPATQIRFVVPRGISPVRLTVFNLLGQEVCRLFEGSGSGVPQIVYWNGTSAAGVPVASGVYVCRLQARSASAARTLHLLR
jgi:hypothetical protein